MPTSSGQDVNVPSRRDRWLTLAAALAGWGLDGFEMGVFPVVARPALQQLLTSPTAEVVRQWNGWLSIAFLLGAALGGYMFGRLGDRVGRVKAMAAAIATYSLFTGLSALVATPYQLAITRFLAATGMGGEWALGVALVVETWPASARPWLAGLIAAAVNVGYVAVALVSRCFDLNQQWRLLLALCALPALLTFVLRMFVPESPAWRSTANEPPVELKNYRRELFWGGSAAALVILAIWGAVQFTQLWAIELSGDVTAAGRVQLVSAGCAIIGAIAGPPLFARCLRRWGYFALSGLAFIAAEWLFLGHSAFDDRFLAAVGLLGLCTGAINGWLTLYLPELFPTRVRGTGVGLCYNAGRILAAAGVAVSVVARDVKGDYAQVCAVVSLAYAVGMVVAFKLPCKPPDGHPQ